MTLKPTYLLQNHVLVSTSVVRNIPDDSGAAEPSLQFSVATPTKVGDDYHVFARLDGKDPRLDFTVAAVGVFVRQHRKGKSNAQDPSLDDIVSTFALEALYDWIAIAARQATSLFFLQPEIPLQAPEPVLLQAS